jgi:hypothetical protein
MGIRDLLTKDSYAAGHFELIIDGAPTTAFLKSVDGGWAKHSIIDEAIGPNNMRVKHAALPEIEPVSFEFGLSGANSVLKWIQESWNKNPSRRSGQISHGDFNNHCKFEHHFAEALITETSFPALDGASKDAAYIKCKFQPENVMTKKGDGKPLAGKSAPKQKMWLCSGFRLNIDGIDEMKYVNKIESFTIKQGCKKLQVGEMRHAELIPTKIEFPNISGTISMAYADKLIAWHEDYINKGKADPAAQRTGSIEFLSPDKSKTLFRINLSEVGLLNTNIQASTANQDQIKRAKFDLYVGRMEIDVGGGAFD